MSLKTPGNSLKPKPIGDKSGIHLDQITVNAVNRKEKKLRWGIISTARINRRIIPCLKNSSRSMLLAVAGRNPERTRRFANRWGVPRVASSYDDILSDPDIDVVYIPLPNSMHCEWVVRSARAGKHILCEKPLGLSPGEVDEMTRSAEENKVVLLEAMAYLMHPQYERLKELIKSNLIGRPRLIRAHYCFTLPDGDGNIRWSGRLGGGVLWDVGCYPVSFSRGLSGCLPTDIWARQIKGPTGVDIISACQLFFPGGLIAEIDCSFVLPYGVGAEVVGEMGALRLPNPWQPDVDGKSSGLIHITPDDTESLISTPVVNPYRCEIEAMENAVLIGELPSYSPAESRDNVDIIYTCYKKAN